MSRYHSYDSLFIDVTLLLSHPWAESHCTPIEINVVGATSLTAIQSIPCCIHRNILLPLARVSKTGMQATDLKNVIQLSQTIAMSR